MAGAAASVLAQLSRLPATQLHHYPDSNAWAANGPAVSRQQAALLGGDPHLPQTEPAIWYEVALSAPGYQVTGVSVAGLPGVLLGHNAQIAWSLTNTQDSSTFYYAEQVRGARRAAPVRGHRDRRDPAARRPPGTGRRLAGPRGAPAAARPQAPGGRRSADRNMSQG
jgi:hypothetical protein